MKVSVVVIGAGPAGLAASSRLAARSIDHVILERGRVAESWRSKRWDSLNLLTPNWMRRLPGSVYDGADPTGFSTKDQTIEFLDSYRSLIAAPVYTGVTVEKVRARSSGFDVITNHGSWECDAVFAATGGMNDSRIPELAAQLPRGVRQLDALSYRNPGEIDQGEVLVVGAAASGTQIAHELQQAGRQVTIAVGNHVRMPRSYRGRDIYWWMSEIGRLDERWDEMPDINRARHVPSPQLTGGTTHNTLDLNTLGDVGVTAIGRLMGVSGTRLQISGSLANTVANSDLKQNRLLAEIDEWVEGNVLSEQVGSPTRPEKTWLGPAILDLDATRFSTVVWATGHRPTYPWLDPAAFGRKGRVDHDGGVGRIPGLYFIGLPFLRRRLSSFIDGIGRDAGDLVDHLVVHLHGDQASSVLPSRAARTV